MPVNIWKCAVLFNVFFVVIVSYRQDFLVSHIRLGLLTWLLLNMFGALYLKFWKADTIRGIEPRIANKYPYIAFLLNFLAAQHLLFYIIDQFEIITIFVHRRFYFFDLSPYSI